jgi:hypothetical protein
MESKKEMEIIHRIDGRRKIAFFHFIFLKRIYISVSAFLSLISLLIADIFLNNPSQFLNFGLFLSFFFAWEFIFYRFSSESYIKKEKSFLSRLSEYLYRMTLKESSLSLTKTKGGGILSFLKGLVVFPIKFSFEVVKFFFTND